MMERCREKCKERNLNPKLYFQSMQSLNIDQKYGLIFMATGNLSLLITNDDVKSTFNHVIEHLLPGGQFILEFEQVMPTGNNKKVSSWGGDWFQGANDAIYVSRYKEKDHPFLPNIWENVLIIEKYVNGQLVETEANQRIGRRFFINEVLQPLEAAGFKDIRATNWQSDIPANKDVDTITVICR